MKLWQLLVVLGLLASKCIHGRHLQDVPRETIMVTGRALMALQSVSNNTEMDSCPLRYASYLPAASNIKGLDDFYEISLEYKRKAHKRLFPLATGTTSASKTIVRMLQLTTSFLCLYMQFCTNPAHILQEVQTVFPVKQVFDATHHP